MKTLTNNILCFGTDLKIARLETVFGNVLVPLAHIVSVTTISRNARKFIGKPEPNPGRGVLNYAASHMGTIRRPKC
jgi:hypothetical protein